MFPALLGTLLDLSDGGRRRIEFALEVRSLPGFGSSKALGYCRSHCGGCRATDPPCTRIQPCLLAKLAIVECEHPCFNANSRKENALAR